MDMWQVCIKSKYFHVRNTADIIINVLAKVDSIPDGFKEMLLLFPNKLYICTEAYLTIVRLDKHVTYAQFRCSSHRRLFEIGMDRNERMYRIVVFPSNMPQIHYYRS